MKAPGLKHSVVSDLRLPAPVPNPLKAAERLTLAPSVFPRAECYSFSSLHHLANLGVSFNTKYAGRVTIGLLWTTECN